MAKMLEMDPYQRITARQALEHEWFDEMRAKDPEYAMASAQKQAETDIYSAQNRTRSRENIGEMRGSKNYKGAIDPSRRSENGLKNSTADAGFNKSQRNIASDMNVAS